MKNFTLSIIFILFLPISFLSAQQVLRLDANSSYIKGDGSGNQAWGPDITMNALKIDGTPGKLAFETQFEDDGFGVAGGRWLQIDYYRVYQDQEVNASEKLIIEFREPVTDVILQVGQLDPNEGYLRSPNNNCRDREGRTKIDESGMYTAYNGNNEIIGSDLLVPDNSIGGKIPGSAGGFNFEIKSSNDQPIKKIVLEATQWGGDNELVCLKYVNSYRDQKTNDSGNTENNSDFNVSAITYTKVDNNGLEEVSINQDAVIVSKANPGVVLQVDDADNRTSVLAEVCSNQGTVWTISDRGNGYHKIMNDFANKAMEAWARNPENGDDVTIYSSNNKNWQQWEIINVGDGYFKIKGRYNNRFITLNNTNVTVQDSNNQDNQLWQLIEPSEFECNATQENSAPVAVDDGAFFGNPDFTVSVGQTVTVPFSELLANDSDPDGDVLTIEAIETIRGGFPRIVGNSVEFTGISEGVGALFGYSINDGNGNTAFATVAFQVTEGISLGSESLSGNDLNISLGTGPIQWGDCTDISAITINGGPGELNLDNGRIGVRNGRFDKQLDYDANSDSSERIEVEFSRPVGELSFTLGNLETNEIGDADEAGTWELLDAAGNIIGFGNISPFSGIDEGNSTYRFETNENSAIAKLVLKATNYINDGGQVSFGNNSDFSLISIDYVIYDECDTGSSVSQVTASTVEENEAPLLVRPTIYPTVFENTLSVKFPSTTSTNKFSMTIYDITGVMVYQDKNLENNEKPIDVSKLKSGIHFVNVNVLGTTFSYKLVKE
ncbi:Arabinogalactan endo-beta-1,4-galactanase [Flagellimonas maritima]|uniref:Arabinogalactan endo-beta-1,4-galactanase n=1 Tax=Flagellimonas maritima TaxID=1383885 RepID=A0A2Z4LPH3_9FLAO|nr:RICIN domain-containing protein [Allomuricauda aurantiaca]AWX43649.1 Arabinogalactan endo-beta-1,4-galactanase [Allomuricauda aurantiaca]